MAGVARLFEDVTRSGANPSADGGLAAVTIFTAALDDAPARIENRWPDRI
jgi:hypothetical protein